MAIETALPQEDDSVILRTYEDGGHTDKHFDTDEMLLETRAQEQAHQQKTERRQRLRHPFMAIREKVIGVLELLDTSEAVRAEQLTKESGSRTLLANTIEGTRRSRETDNA